MGCVPSPFKAGANIFPEKACLDQWESKIFIHMFSIFYILFRFSWFEKLYVWISTCGGMKPLRRHKTQKIAPFGLLLKAFRRFHAVTNAETKANTLVKHPRKSRHGCLNISQCFKYSIALQHSLAYPTQLPTSKSIKSLEPFSPNFKWLVNWYAYPSLSS